MGPGPDARERGPPGPPCAPVPPGQKPASTDRRHRPTEAAILSSSRLPNTRTAAPRRRRDGAPGRGVDGDSALPAASQSGRRAASLELLEHGKLTPVGVDPDRDCGPGPPWRRAPAGARAVVTSGCLGSPQGCLKWEEPGSGHACCRGPRCPRDGILGQLLPVSALAPVCGLHVSHVSSRVLCRARGRGSISPGVIKRVQQTRLCPARRPS